MKWIVMALLVAAGSPAHQGAERPKALGADSPEQEPKAARTAIMVYDASESDAYHAEMIVEKSADNSFFAACAWQNGFFGLQQYDGEGKRTVIFSVWNHDEDADPEALKKEPVEVVWKNDRYRANPAAGGRSGLQCIRQADWRAEEVNRFVVRAVVTGKRTTYTAWFYDRGAGAWEKIAELRARTSTAGMRGFSSHVEDFRRDYRSAKEVRRARFCNVWNHEEDGKWFSIFEGTFTASRARLEARETVDGGERDGCFTLATGGETKMSQPLGARVRISAGPLRRPEPPEVPFVMEQKSGRSSGQGAKER